MTGERERTGWAGNIASMVVIEHRTQRAVHPVEKRVIEFYHDQYRHTMGNIGYAQFRFYRNALSKIVSRSNFRRGAIEIGHAQIMPRWRVYHG